jgi:hypothetical protein
MISVEINTALKKHLEDLGSFYKNVPIFPLYAYDQTQAPFILYSESDTTLNDEQYFIKISNILYYIYDNDMSRMKDIAYQIDKFMNVGDKVIGIKKMINSPSESYGEKRYRLTSSRKSLGAMFPPLEREGFASQSLDFRVFYLNIDESDVDD